MRRPISAAFGVLLGFDRLRQRLGLDPPAIGMGALLHPVARRAAAARRSPASPPGDRVADR